jgi:predicted nucleic acid-binding protein
VTVVSDTSPLSALARLGLLHLLPALYRDIVIPASVAREASHPNAPVALQHWIAALPAGVTITPDPAPLLVEVLELDPGEAAAITLAHHLPGETLLLVDDRAARIVCAALQIPHTGTAGLLLTAANAGMVDFQEVLSRLQKTPFRLSDSVIAELMRRLNQP